MPALWQSLFSTAQPSTGLLPTILSVGIATYLIVLNINTLVQSSHTLYNSQKRRLVSAMKADNAAYWRKRGKRFDVFKAKHESIGPSEWYLPLYAVLRIGQLRHLWRRKSTRTSPTGASRVTQSDTARHERPWWSLRKDRSVEAPWEDEGWVM